MLGSSEKNCSSPEATSATSPKTSIITEEASETSDIVKVETSDIVKVETSDIVKVETSDIVKAVTDTVNEVCINIENTHDVSKKAPVNQDVMPAVLKCKENACFVSEGTSIPAEKRNSPDDLSDSNNINDDPYHDLIGSNIIRFRDYLYHMEDIFTQLNDVSSLDNIDDFLSNIGDNVPDFPELTANHPFHRKLMQSKDNSQVIEKTLPVSLPSKKTAEKRIKIFITNVIRQNGFREIEKNSLVLSGLSELVDEFLTKITKALWINCRTRSSDAMIALETTLQDIGFGGVLGLHEFYYHSFIKKHDYLYEQCLNMQEEFVKKVDGCK